MKIALYQPWIYVRGGLERSLLELVSRSRHEWIVYTGHYEPENTFDGFADIDVRVLNPTTVRRTIKGTLLNALQVARQRIPAVDEVDAVIIWCDGIGDLLALRNHDQPLFNICSTPLRAAFDPVYEQLSLVNKPFTYRLAYQCFKHLFRLVDRLAWSYFDGIVTTSTEVRNRIVKGRLCVDPDRMVMAYPGVEWNPSITDVSYEPFVLLPGRIMWTKNIQQGIEGFVRAGLPAPWRLVIAGFVDQKSESYLGRLRAMVPPGAQVEFILRPSDAELEDLYRRAAFCLFTPLNEDWGIVPLECMNHGKAVIANASGGPLESIADGTTGILVEPTSTTGWAEAIRRLALQPEACRSMGQAGHEHVRQFDWSRFVQAVDTAVEHWAEATDVARAPQS